MGNVADELLNICQKAVESSVISKQTNINYTLEFVTALNTRKCRDITSDPIVGLLITYLL